MAIKRVEFANVDSTLCGSWKETDQGERLYVVFVTRGGQPIYPLYIYVEATNTWYGDELSHAAASGRPRIDAEVTMLTRRDMHTLAKQGIVGLVASKFNPEEPKPWSSRPFYGTLLRKHPVISDSGC
jgi:hypothetical protein